jgi:hypothetical protein
MIVDFVHSNNRNMKEGEGAWKIGDEAQRSMCVVWLKNLANTI